MEISLRQRGGVFGLDRHVVLDRRGLSVRDAGDQPGLTRVDARDRRRVTTLALRAVERAADFVGHDTIGVPDDLVNEVRIHLPNRTVDVTFTTADDAPDELWELVGELSEQAEQSIARSRGAFRERSFDIGIPRTRRRTRLGDRSTS